MNFKGLALHLRAHGKNVPSADLQVLKVCAWGIHYSVWDNQYIVFRSHNTKTGSIRYHDIDVEHGREAEGGKDLREFMYKDHVCDKIGESLYMATIEEFGIELGDLDTEDTLESMLHWLKEVIG